MKTGRFLSILLLLTTTINLSAQNEAVKIKSYFEPQKISHGNASNYIIIIEGTLEEVEGDIPQVKGLTLQSAGPVSRRAGFDDGRRFSIVEHTFIAYPQSSGTFNIPSFNLYIKGIPYQVPAAKLEVEEARPAQDAIAEKIDFNFKLGTDEPYAGEMVPVEISLYAPGDIPELSLISNPKLSSTAFIDHGIKTKPIKNQFSKNSKPYVSVTWKTFITPLKTGSFPLEYTVDASAAVNTRLTSPTYNSVFGRAQALIRQSFRSEEISFKLTTPITNIKVIPLPTTGRPKSFSGAIGDFKIEEPTIDQFEVSVGDPITLRFALSGEGNFDHITVPELNLSAEWKVYKPKTDFTSDDSFNFKGRKEFEYILIPQSDKIKHTPPITFSTFDPSLSRYRELQDFTIPIKVKPDLTASAQQPTPQTNPTPIAKDEKPTPTPQISKNKPSPIELLPNKLDITKKQKTLTPIFSSPFFLAPQLIPLILIAGFYFYKKRELRLSEDKNYARSITHQEILNQLSIDLEQNYKEQNYAAFYNTAESIIKEKISFISNKEKSSLTGSDVSECLRRKSAPDELVRDINLLFNLVEGLKYGGDVSSKSIASEEYTKTQKILKELQKCLKK